MFEIKTTDEDIMQQYLRKKGIKNEFRYLFTFDENYIFMVKENKSINTYCAICVMKNCSVTVLKSKQDCSESIKKKLIDKLMATNDYQVTLPEKPHEMIDYIFIKLMAENGFSSA
mgnify:FL=1